MSDGSNQGDKIMLEPLKSIGAQDLLKVGYQFYGHLRKQRKLERILGSRRWGRKFLVIAHGCVYCYKDEYSKSPLSAFSLSIYEGAEAFDMHNVLNCFNITHEDHLKPTHVFSCETDEKRQEWLLHLNDAIRKAHYHSGSCSGSASRSVSDDEDEGIGRSMPRKSYKAKLPEIPKTPSTEDAATPQKKPVNEYDLEEDEPYDDIVEVSDPPPSDPATASRARLALPGMASEKDRSELANKAESVIRRPPHKLPRPPVANRPTPARAAESYVDVNMGNMNLEEQSDYQNDETPEDYENSCIFQPEEYVFDSNDRGKSTGYLQAKPVGTFLIRNARSGPGKVLSVQTDTIIREFKILEKDDGTVSLDNTDSFKTIGQMVGAYTQKCLPKKDLELKLLKGYKS